MKFHGFETVIIALKEGKRCRRGNWPDGDFIFASSCKIYSPEDVLSEFGSHHVSDHFKGREVYENNKLCYVRNGAIVETYRLSSDDIFMPNWRILD